MRIKIGEIQKMDKFNPREIDGVFKAYEKIIEQLPYDGIHINHQNKVDHIKKVYSSTYKVVQSPSTKSWYVMGQVGPEWLPVTSSFVDKAGADKFMQWLNKAGEMQKQMVGTIDGTDKRINEKYTVKYKMKKSDSKISVAEYKDKKDAEKFLNSIKKKGGNGIISEETLNETTGNWLHGRFGDLFDFLENQAFGSLKSKVASKVIPTLKKETEKLYKLYQKNLKGSGLSGW